MNPKVELATSIRRLRRDRDLTQEQLADLLGFANKSTISKIESAEYPIEWRTILLIATYLKDDGLLLKWWNAEKRDLVEENDSLRGPLATIDRLMRELSISGAFSGASSRPPPEHT